MSGEIVVRSCEGLDEFRACVALQKEIWNEADLEIVPDTIFVVALHTGGQILGAFDGKRLIGFTLSMNQARALEPLLLQIVARELYLRVAVAKDGAAATALLDQNVGEATFRSANTR